MKKNVFFLMCLMVSLVIFGQNETPTFTGSKALDGSLKTDNSTLIDNYLKKNLICPERAAQCCKEGTEIIQFTVSESGKVKDFKVINSVCTELDKEVVRVLKTTNGMWKPGVKNGKPVAMTKVVTFMFGNHDKSTIVNYFVKVASRHYKIGSKNLIIKNNPRKALWHFNKGVNYMPNDKALLALRGLCHYELGDETSARKDFNKIVELGGIADGVNFDELAEMKGYDEMTMILAK